jgi:leader peptidase (prepilin peptidase) / N-methyltransferase
VTEAANETLRVLSAGWAALLGAAVGSFLNVVVARLPRGESLVRPGSRCPRCATPIRWYDNVPILSWLALRARCRACGAPISARYPLVEALGAGAALLAWSRHGLTAAALAEFAFVAALLALAFIDLDTWLLPHAITWPLIASGLALGATGWTPAGTFAQAAYGAGVGFAVFALVAWGGEKLLKKEAMGWGDVWLLAGLGAWLGVKALLPVILLASVQGALVGIALIALGRAETGARAAVPEPPRAGGEDDEDWVPPRHAVPFGPFLVAGALEWLWLGDRIAALVPTLEVFR